MNTSKKIAVTAGLILALCANVYPSDALRRMQFGIMSGVSFGTYGSPLFKFYELGLLVGGGIKIRTIILPKEFVHFRLNAYYQYFIPKNHPHIPITQIPGEDGISIDVKPISMGTFSFDSYTFFNGSSHITRPFFKFGAGALFRSRLRIKSEDPRVGDTNKAYKITSIYNIGFGLDVRINHKTSLRFNMGESFVWGDIATVIYVPLTVTYIFK